MYCYERQHSESVPTIVFVIAVQLIQHIVSFAITYEMLKLKGWIIEMKLTQPIRDIVSMWQLGYRLCLEMLKCILNKTISKENKKFHTGTNNIIAVLQV